MNPLPELNPEQRTYLKTEVNRRSRQQVRIRRQLENYWKEDDQMPGILKEFRKLAERVNALDGWTATIVTVGSHAGRAYEVHHNDRLMGRFSGSPSVPSLALWRAESELRRWGCPLPHKDQTKEDIIMPMPSAEDKERCAKLRPFLTRAIRTLGKDQFITLAVTLAEENETPFVSRYQARKSLDAFIDGKFLTGAQLVRYEVATTAATNGEQTRPPQTGEEVTHGLPEPEPTTPEPEPTPEPTDNLEQLVRELRVAEGELLIHRDPYLKARDKVIMTRLEIIELMQKEEDL